MIPGSLSMNQATLTKPSCFLTIFLYVQCSVVIFFAYFRELLLKIGYKRKNRERERECMKDFTPLFDDFHFIYAKNIYWRHRDCGSRPVISSPDHLIKIRQRKTTDGGWTLQETGRIDEVINFGSYNYLGFSQNFGPCAQQSANAIDKCSVASCSPRHELGNLKIHNELEQKLAKFLGVQDSVCFAMGFSTNMSNIGCLVGPNSLILSDQYNHSSIVKGCRLSKAARIEIFKHNNVADLELRLKNAIIRGNGKNRYDKILVCVEGIYSMEGTIVPLPEIVALKHLYKFYLYLDEAHSIGALGESGRGVCDYFGVDPNEIDVLMGTFTKGFGSVGGYIAGKKSTIDHIRTTSPELCYGYGLSAPCAQQVITGLEALMATSGNSELTEGQKRVETLARNTRYFQVRLRDLGIPVYGHEHSPVVTVPLYFMTKIVYACRAMLTAGIGAVVVAYPATEITSTRIRFCLSALHTKQDLDTAIVAMDSICDLINIRQFTKSDASEKGGKCIDY